MGTDAPTEGRDKVGDQPQTLVGISFEDAFRAREFMTAANRLASKGDLVLADTVPILKDDGGHTKVAETTAPPSSQPCAKRGDVGRTRRPVARWSSGLGGGYRRRRRGWSHCCESHRPRYLHEWASGFREAAKPGSATVALLVSDLQEDSLLREARRFAGSHLVFTNLADGMIDRLADALGDATGPDARTDLSQT